MLTYYTSCLLRYRNLYKAALAVSDTLDVGVLVAGGLR